MAHCWGFLGCRVSTSPSGNVFKGQGEAGVSVAWQTFPWKYEDSVVGFHSVAKLLGNAWQNTMSFLCSPDPPSRASSSSPAPGGWEVRVWEVVWLSHWVQSDRGAHPHRIALSLDAGAEGRWCVMTDPKLRAVSSRLLTFLLQLSRRVRTTHYFLSPKGLACYFLFLSQLILYLLD